MNSNAQAETAQMACEELIRRNVERAVASEQERCARAASDACLEQDEAGHSRNFDTWIAACAWVRMRITGAVPKTGISAADLIREGERERCAKIASAFTMKAGRNIHPDIAWDDMSESAKLVSHTTAQQIAAAIRSGE